MNDEVARRPPRALAGSLILGWYKTSELAEKAAQEHETKKHSGKLTVAIEATVGREWWACCNECL
jgi:hypothetical protein